MEFAIAIDSGGTNYRLRAIDGNGRMLSEYTGKPANHYHVGLEALPEIINSSISALLSSFGGERKDCRALFCGTTGLDSDEDDAFLNSFYRDSCGLSCPVRVISDAELAHYAVTGGEGVLLISGTGAIAFGCSREGRRGRSGGWLFSILGDQGGGAWVSRRALQHLSRFFDGAVSDSELLMGIRERLSISSRSDLNRLARTMGEPPWTVPSLGKIVSEAADSGDAEAIRIFQEAASFLFSLVEDIDSALSISRTYPDFPVGLWGSTVLGSSAMRTELERLIKGKYPEARLMLPNKSALDEAAELALKLWKSGS